MKILKLLNKKNLIIVIIYLFSTLTVFAEDKPIDIWNIDKKENKIISETNLSNEKTETISESSIYDMQANKKKDPIKLDQKLVSKEIKN